MRVFLSWSGERSRLLADALRGWLRPVIQSIDPWMSAEDLSKGTRWGLDLATQLEDTDFGLLCVTRENTDTPWLLFEAGALSKKEQARVIPILLDIEPIQLKGPIRQFNAATAYGRGSLGQETLLPRNLAF